MLNPIPWQFRSRKMFRLWLDVLRVHRHLRAARKAGRAVLSVSGGIVLE